MSPWITILVLAGLAFVYLIPTILAGYRDHPSYAAILWLNLLTGWTGIGWFIAFIWSLTGRSSPKTIPCPHCAEQILPEAKICRHCHLSVNPELRIVR